MRDSTKLKVYIFPPTRISADIIQDTIENHPNLAMLIHDSNMSATVKSKIYIDPELTIDAREIDVNHQFGNGVSTNHELVIQRPMVLGAVNGVFVGKVTASWIVVSDADIPKFDVAIPTLKAMFI